MGSPWKERMTFSSSSEIWISSYSCCLYSRELPKTMRSNIVLRTTPVRPAVARWRLLRVPFTTTRLPGMTRPVRSSVRSDREPLRVGPALEVLRVLLHFDPLRVVVGRLLRHQPEPGPTLRLVAAPLGGIAAQGFAEAHRGLVLLLMDLVVAGETQEHGVPDLRTDLGRLSDDPVDGHEPSQVDLPDPADLPMGGRGHARDADPQALRLGAGHREELPEGRAARLEHLLRPLQQKIGQLGVGPLDLPEGDLRGSLLGEAVRELQDPGSAASLLEHGDPAADELGRRGQGTASGHHHKIPLRLQPVTVARE